jgi:hypothetical protein
MKNTIQNGELIHLYGKVSKLTESNNEYIISLKFDKSATIVGTSDGMKNDNSTKNRLPDPNKNFILIISNENSSGELESFTLKDLSILEIKNDVISVLAKNLPFKPKDLNKDAEFTFKQAKIKKVTLFGVVDDTKDLNSKNQLTILVDRSKSLQGYSAYGDKITVDATANPDLNSYCLTIIDVKPSDENIKIQTESLGNGKIIEIVENKIKILFEDEISFPIEEIKKGMQISISSL